MEEMIEVLLQVYLIMAAVFFIGLFLFTWLLSGMGRGISLSVRTIILASIFWPKTWWLWRQGIGLKDWENYRNLRKRNLKENEARKLVGREVIAAKEFFLGVPRPLIQKGTKGKIVDIAGSKKMRFELLVMWQISNPNRPDGWPGFVRKSDFKKDGRVVLAD